MSSTKAADRDHKKLIRLLQNYQKLLSVSGADADIQRIFSAYLEFTQKLNQADLQKIFGDRPAKPQSLSSIFGSADVEKMTLDQITAVLEDENTSRRALEVIAVRRFGVPKGSMRSFSRISDLREKIAVSIKNERAHQVIKDAANK